MIIYKQKKVDAACLEEYEKVPMTYSADEIYQVEKSGHGLGGIAYSFELKAVPTFFVDFDDGDRPLRWARRFNTENWTAFIAYDGDRAIGGCTLVAKTPQVCMLDGRDDMVVLWDIRVREEWKSRGIGKRLFELAKEWSRENGYCLMKIECQNTNAAACRFYEKQGAELAVVNRNAYKTGEYMLIWYLDLSK